ncbi:MAG TPA: LptA/OstA family protein, partial [Candidatus Wallbacteria bacterium]|nr:LptA/OstA family protein [Candidatus Wallbacteria bacterium]
MKEKRAIKIFLILASLLLAAIFVLQIPPQSSLRFEVYAQQAEKAGAAEKTSGPEAEKAKTAAAGKKKQAIEITGDLFEMESDGTYVITGNVHVYQGSRTIVCERGTYNEKTGIVRAFTNVEILDAKFKMKCQRVDSHMKENYSLFSGGVVVDGNNFKATSERAFYYEKEEKAVLIGNPVAKSLDQTPNEVHGERIIYFMKTERMEVLNNVTAFIQPKEKEKEGAVTHITGNRLEILTDGRYQVTDNLRVLKKDMILYADRGIYDETSEVTEAFGNVKVETSKYTLTSGYVKHLAKEDRTLANIKPRLIQIVDKKKRVLPSDENKPESSGGDASEKTAAGESGQAAEGKDGKDDGGEKTAGAESEGKESKKEISNKDKIILEANEIEALENSTHIVAKGDASLVQFPYLGQEGTEGVEINSKIES